MAGSTSASGRVVATAAIQAAAERCGLAVPLNAVPGAVAAPITSEEAMKWLSLAARAFDAAGCKIEAGRLLLGMGPAAGGGNFLRLARKLLLDGCRVDEAARVLVAGMFEEAAQRELSQEGSHSARDPVHGSSSAGQPAEAGGAVPASRLLHDAFQLHLKSKQYDECKRLLQQYPYLQRALPPKSRDDVELVRKPPPPPPRCGPNSTPAPWHDANGLQPCRQHCCCMPITATRHPTTVWTFCTEYGCESHTPISDYDQTLPHLGAAGLDPDLSTACW